MSIDLAQSYWAFTGNYIAAADTLLNQEKAEHYLPSLYLLCHAYELSLKTYLIVSDVPVDKLKNKFGHDLCKLLHEANTNGLSQHIEVSENEANAVEAFNVYYKDKDMPLKYFSQTCKTFPPIAELRSLVDRTHKAVAKVIVTKSFDQFEES